MTSGFDDGQTIERGGELIDQGRTAIRQLWRELGLPLDGLLAAESNGPGPLYYFHGAPPATRPPTARGRELGAMSIIDWPDEPVRRGGEQIVERLAAPVADRIRAGHALTAIARNSDGPSAR